MRVIGTEGLRTKELFAFMRERYAIFLKKEAGEPKPWTADPILQRFRFCNIYREDDKVTRWIRVNWREPHTDDPDLWFAMVVARHLNLPASLEELGYPVPWDGARFVELMTARKARNERNFSAAYMIGTNGNPVEKAIFLEDRIFTPLWQARDTLRPRAGDTLTAYHMMLGQIYGLASFLTAQVIADTKFHGVLRQAPDWWDFAASGPGSRRGLNRVIGRDKDAGWREDDWRLTLARLRGAVEPLVLDAGMPPLSAQDLQNSLCEFDKYERARLGEGRPKQLYAGV
jgi:hypothetical protein